GQADALGDLYALGLVLFELLTGQHPYPAQPGSRDDLIERILPARKLPPSSARGLNPAISPAVDAILRRLLDPNPKNRYQSARELQEDLEAHLANLPLQHTREPSWRERLRKWRRRHPRLAAASAATLVVSLFVLLPFSVIAVRSRDVARAEAITSMTQAREDFRSAEFYMICRLEDPQQRRRGTAQAQAILDRYPELECPNWPARPEIRRLAEAERQQFTEELGELLLLLSHTEQEANAFQVSLDLNQRAEQCLGDRSPASLWNQRAELLEKLGRQREADEHRRQPRPAHPAADLDLMQEALNHILAHDYRQALVPLEKITQSSPKYHRAWFNAGHCYFMLGRMIESAASFSVCIALQPESPWAYYCRALARGRTQEFAGAVADLDRALKLKPDSPDYLVNRAIYRGKLNDLAGAEADFARALELGDSPARVYLVRSRVR